MRVLLVQPDWSRSNVGFNRLTLPEPLPLEIVAASVPTHEVRIVDLRLESGLERILGEFRPQVVGTTGYTADVPQARNIVKTVKQYDRSIYTVVGGHHASLMPEDFDSDDVDFVVIGEGEETFPELITALESGSDYTGVAGMVYRRGGRQIHTGPRTLMKDLNDTPRPARHLVEKYRDHYYFRFWSAAYTMESARGCPYRCTFCSVWKFYQSHCRMKTAERVAAEIAEVPGDYICFVDDNFMQSMTRAERIGKLLKERGIRKRYWMQARSDSIVRRPDVMEQWAELGLSTILIGLEAFREEDLAAINKKNSVANNERAIEIMHQNNLDIWGAFLVDPNWGESDFTALIDYVRSLKISFPQFTVLTPLPGTDLYAERHQDLITRNYERFDFFHSVLPTKLPLEEFYENMARLYASTTMSLSDLRKKIRAGNIPVESLRRVRGMLDQLTNPQSYLAGIEG